MPDSSRPINLLKRENALLMRQSPRWLQFFGVLMLLLGIGVISAGFIVRLDEVVTATGMLKSKKGREDVKTPAGGKVAEVFVKNGEYVNKNDLLMRFDTTEAKEQKARSSGLIELEKKSLSKGKNSLILQRLTLQQRLQTQKEITASYSSLSDFGGISRIQMLEAQDQVLELETKIDLIDEQMRQQELETQKRIRSLQSDLQAAEQKLLYQNVIAGTSGIVFDLQARQGGVISPGSTIMSIIPTDGLRAEVFVSNADIGFIKEGQIAKVRINAYPSERYGELNGSVALIGADALPPDNTNPTYRFPVDISLDKDVLEREGLVIPLRSGMAITSNLKIREKRAITLVSDIFSGQLDSLKALRQ